MQTIFDLLEWPRITEHLASCCQTGYGRLRVGADGFFLPDTEAMGLEMQRVEEAKLLILRYGDVSMQEPPDILPTLKHLAKQGEIRSPEELGELLLGLKQLRQLMRFLLQNRSRETTPLLQENLEAVTLPNPIIEQLEALVDERSELRDSASPRYGELRLKIQDIQTQIRNILQGMISRGSVVKYLQEPIITEREGRSVLPVKSEHKVDVPGIVHGTSMSGSSLYIEPRAVVDFNNRLVSARGELEREIRRILREVSETLHPEAEGLIEFVDQVAGYDLLLAKARQSLVLKANPLSIIEEAGVLRLKQARHPLLVLKLSAVVPNDIILEPPHRIMLITGPNTGGKTVVLKLLGLFSLMMSAGLHVPAGEGSEMSWFSPVLADVGDPQNILQSLSTFSGHMARLKAFLEEPDLSRSLILIDEICAGTDPQEGSALAEALLETFYDRGATAVVTTHIGELKVVAHQHIGYLNACVEFNTETLSPTYRLMLGVPGTSNALNIAARLGIPESVVSMARGRVSQPASESAALIESLELKNRQIADDLTRAASLREELVWEEEQLREQLNRLEGEKKRILQMFREGLKHKLLNIENEVDALKEEVNAPFKRDKTSLQEFSGRFKRLQSQTGEVFQNASAQLYPQPGITWDSLKIGDTVESRSMSLTGIIIALHPTRQEVTLQAGMLKTTVPLSDIIQRQPLPATRKRKGPHKSLQAPEREQTSRPDRQSAMSMECDVRGLNGEDAVGIVDKFLDEALLAGAGSLHVIHGLGTGALKRAIRSHLKDLPYVKAFGPASASDGGDGKTIIDL